MSDGTRINQFVAAATGLSRRAADAAVAAGRVKSGTRVATLGDQVQPGDQIYLDDRLINLPEAHRYIALNKPVGYVSSRSRQGSDPTVYELLPPQLHRLKIAGRLDLESSGLLLLTDDGEFINRFTHPSFDKAKIYELTLQRPLTDPDRRKLESGVELQDGPSAMQVSSVRGSDITVSLAEGRNRQIRRTLGALGYTVKSLHRTKVGPYGVENLAPGAWREVQAQ